VNHTVAARPSGHFFPGTPLAVGAIVALGLVLRVIGLRWGLPCETHLYSYHPDEIPILHGVAQLNLFEGRLNPHFFNYGTFYLYLVHAVVVFASGLGWIDPSFATVEDVARLHLIGRGVNVVFGAATILLTFLLGHRVANEHIGIMASLFLALMPGLIANAHYATVDVTLTFWTTLALLLMTYGDEEDKGRWAFWSGVVVGLSAATRYTAGLLIIPLLVQSAVGKRVGRRFVFSILGALSGFLFGCPGAVFAFPEFCRDFLFELHHSQTGSGLIFQHTGNGWWYHLTHNLPFATGLPLWLLLLSLTGYLFKGNYRASSRGVLVLWVVVYFGFLGLGKIRFLRYLLPLLPCLVVMLAEALLLGWMTSSNDVKQKRRLACSLRKGAGCALAVVVTTAIGMVGANAALQFVQPDPRDQARAWLQPQLRHGTTVALITLPWFYTPPISPFNGGLKSLWGFESWQREALYKVVVTGWDWGTAQKRKPDFFVVSEFETREEVRLHLPEPRTFLNRLARQYRLVAQFKNREFVPTPWLSGIFVPHDWLYPNPRISVYKRFDAGG